MYQGRNKDQFQATASGETTIVEVQGYVNKRGMAKVKIIQSGLLRVNEGTVVPNFNLYHGVLKFERIEK